MTQINVVNEVTEIIIEEEPRPRVSDVVIPFPGSAATIPFTPPADMSATTVAAAINELKERIAPLQHIYDLQAGMKFRDDFMALNTEPGGIGELGWTGVSTDGGVINPGGINFQGGWARLDTGTSASTGGYLIYLPSHYTVVGQETLIDGRFYRGASSATQHFQFNFGYADFTTFTTAEVKFRLDAINAGAHEIKSVTNDGVNEEVQSTGVFWEPHAGSSAVAAAYKRFRIQYTGDAWLFFLDDMTTPVTVHQTYVPAPFTSITPTASIVKLSGTGSRWIEVDWIAGYVGMER